MYIYIYIYLYLCVCVLSPPASSTFCISFLFAFSRSSLTQLRNMKDILDAFDPSPNVSWKASPELRAMEKVPLVDAGIQRFALKRNETKRCRKHVQRILWAGRRSCFPTFWASPRPFNAIGPQKGLPGPWPVASFSGCTSCASILFGATVLPRSIQSMSCFCMSFCHIWCLCDGCAVQHVISCYLTQICCSRRTYAFLSLLVIKLYAAMHSTSLTPKLNGRWLEEP